MAAKTKTSRKTTVSSSSSSRNGSGSNGNGRTGRPPGKAPQTNEYGIPDWRLEKPDFKVIEVSKGPDVHYEIRGALDAPVPPIRESQYLSKEQCVQLYRWMLLNRRMEQALENLYKQGKVVGGVYFGLGQESCSCASALALGPDDWFAPMIRNQGAQLVRGFHARDIMMQYMAKAGSPTGGKDGTSHYGDIEERNMVSPISMLGDLLPVMAGVSLGARLQGKELACLTWIGDGGQSTGVSYEGINFAAVRKLGLVLIVESNLWAYSTPTEYQVAVKDLANRAIGYGIPAVIVDGTDACQVYDATYEAVARAHRGEGPTMIEAKMMRMKGHAIHDAAAYVPEELLAFWRKRDPIDRFEKFLLAKKWLTPEQNRKLVEEVEKELEADREIAVNSPMPEPHTAAEGVYCDKGCHDIKPKYGTPKAAKRDSGKLKETEAAIHYK
ncbi:MAG TPA: thiamine pyrophosphate-dependent dehydrogenase E1 component subunit alpha [Candidatus Angelobacter sp.]|nr:thiamine pyrophosphate-dependent dehydrogenase E1 component subunit alpha [Candidatus Angelobacter sp.]